MPRNYTNQSDIDKEFSWLDGQASNRDKYIEYVEGDHVDITRDVKRQLPGGFRLIKRVTNKDLFEIMLVSHHDQAILYYIRCQVIPDVCLSSAPVTQVLLWKNIRRQYAAITQGFASDVFNNILLEEYNIIASDGSQTFHGKRFWTNMMDMALANGHSVYRYDRLAGSCEHTELVDIDDIITNVADLWGDGEEYEHILALITKDPL